MKALEPGPLREKYRVIKAIYYETGLDDDGGFWLAWTLEPPIWWGEGETEEDAVADLIDTLINVYEHEIADEREGLSLVYLDPPVRDYIEAVES